MGREIIYGHATVTCDRCFETREIRKVWGTTIAVRNLVILGLWNVAIDDHCQLAK